MGDVTVAVGGRNYRLACRDGEEAALARAARHLDEQAARIVRALGPTPEPRLLLMAGLQVAGELLERGPPAPAPAERLVRVVQRLERLAQQLEDLAGKADGLEGTPRAS
ncbi:MAG: cell division protein ZapA [Sphingomonadaceae bacterium]|uniref:cell division protein ZapA n=1 Tax=Thermaurantiacus sp. TaxID=2820283 RepID=UPI00298F020D|nr:cell division protein ZapA [Thermaurantiacus sp.]MCS6986659.1 cell division protein ZapA [Sphingomonadaceae bacterium]MDW8414079.1 cell division protein ZapA [Thermaurantiacus sp.]